METMEVSTANSQTESRPGPTVLIVEPLPDQQWKLARMFTVGGYRTIGTSSTVAALALLRSCPVELILVSAEACEAGVIEVVRKLRSEAPDARVLVMGGADSEALVNGPAYVARPQRVADVARFAMS